MCPLSVSLPSLRPPAAAGTRARSWCPTASAIAHGQTHLRRHEGGRATHGIALPLSPTHTHGPCQYRGSRPAPVFLVPCAAHHDHATGPGAAGTARIAIGRFGRRGKTSRLAPPTTARPTRTCCRRNSLKSPDGRRSRLWPSGLGYTARQRGRGGGRGARDAARRRRNRRRQRVRPPTSASRSAQHTPSLPLRAANVGAHPALPSCGHHRNPSGWQTGVARNTRQPGRGHRRAGLAGGPAGGMVGRMDLPPR